MEYRLAILRDKYDYLGEAYCTEEEIKLAALVEFPPLNYCCYPAVPEKYIVPRENPWIPSEKAIVYMKELAAECEDTSLLKMLEFYRKHPAKFWAKRLAVMLQICCQRDCSRQRQIIQEDFLEMMWNGGISKH